MALDVSKLKEQIAKEKESLKSVDENIKKITGRDPNEIRERQGNDTRRVSVGGPMRGRDHAPPFRRPWKIDSQDAEKDSEPPRKRAAVFSRLGASVRERRVAVSRSKPIENEDDDYDEEDTGVKPAVQSSVVSTAKKITKDDLISAQNVGERGKARNRRMFGMLLGTLAKFNADGQGRQSKQILKQKAVETRLEEETEQERKKLASERKILFTERRQQQRRINLMEEKVALANELIEWEQEWEKKSHFIMTKATPSIFFLPNDFSPRTQRALQASKERIKGLVEKRRTSVAETMGAYDDEIKILENKQEYNNGKGLKNGEGVHVHRGLKKGARVEHEPEEEMDLDSMEHHVDIKVDVEDAEQDAGRAEAETMEPTEVQASVESQDTEAEEPPVQQSVAGVISDDNVEQSNSVEASPVHENEALDGEEEQGIDITAPTSNENVEVQPKECDLSVLPPSQESTATEDATEMKSESPDKHDGECDTTKQPDAEDDSSESSSTAGSDGKESDKDIKMDDVEAENPSPVQNSSVVAPQSDLGNKSEVTVQEPQQEQVKKTDEAPSTEDAPKKEVTKNTDVAVSSSRDRKPGSSRRRRDSSSSDSTSSSSSSDDDASRKTRSRRYNNRSRSTRDSRDSYRSKRYQRDRSRSRDRRDRSRSKDRGSRRDRRRR